MNKKFLSAILLGALAVSAGSFVSCKSYDDDIDNLRKEIANMSSIKADASALSSAIDAAKSALQSDIKTAAQQAVADAKAQALEEAKKEIAKIQTGASMEEVQTAISNAIAKINACNCDVDGKIAEAVAALAKSADVEAQLSTLEQKIKTDMAALYLQQDALEGYAKATEVTAAVDAAKTALTTAIESAKTAATADAIAAAKKAAADAVAKVNSDLVVLSARLSSIVFYPNFYVDGIEAEEYGVFDYAALIAQTTGKKTGTNEVNGTNPGTEAYTITTANNVWDYEFAEARTIIEPAAGTVLDPDVKEALKVKVNFGTRQIYNTVGTAEYHVNPSIADLTGAKYDFNSRIVQRVGTRADNQLGIKVAGAKNENGILKVNYKGNYSTTNIPEYYGKDEVTDKTYGSVEANNTPIFALEVATADTTVTSDYAMLYVTPVVPVAIAFTQDTDDAVQLKKKIACPVAGQHNHLYDNPADAIENDPEWQLLWDAEDYFDVTKHLQLHINKYSPIKKNAAQHAVVKYGDEAQYGLHYEFKLIDYTVGGNSTSDSHYCYTDKVAEGKMKASYVSYENGSSLNKPGRSSIGKKPLLQVTVKDEAGNIVIDGYVKFVIVEKIVAPTPDDLETSTFTFTGAFNCKGISVKNTWYQTSTGLYQFVDDKLGMGKEEFHKNYELDKINVSTDPDPDKNPDWVAVQYLAMNGSAANYPALGNTSDYLGVVKEIVDKESETNYVYEWTLNDAEQQYIWENTDNTAKRWVRFTHKTNSLKHIWIPLQVTVEKSSTAKNWSDKITNYWFSHTPNAAYTDDPDEAQRLNVPYPTDEGATKTIREDKSKEQSVRHYVVNMNNAFVKNKVIVDGYNTYDDAKTVKFYFSSKTDGVVVTDANTNKSYTLSTDASKVTCYVWPKNVELDWEDGIETKHQILATTGVYNNNVLYANEGNTINTTTRVKIAELNQNTGVVTYIWEDGNTIAKQVLNATGHKTAGEYAYIGISAPDACTYALPVAAPYPAYFLRPLDIDAEKEGKVVDAKSNADYVKFGDMLACTDWRDVNLLTKENAWLFAYYGVGKIKIDTDNVMTTLNQPNSNSKTANYVKLSDVTNNLKLTYVDQDKKPISGNTIDLSALYDDTWTEANSAACYEKLSTIFGQIKYENNGNNVYDFWFKVPVTYSYEWGTIVGNIYVNVVRTQGN